MDRFHSETIGEAGSRVTLTSEETRHMVAVRRVAPGDEVTLFDGAGREATARVVAVEEKRAVVEVLSVRRAERNARCRLTVATALPKGQRAAALVRACTEIGAWRIQPVISERSVVRPERGKVIDRLVRAAREAAKQSRRAWTPEVMPVATFAEVMVGLRSPDGARDDDDGGYDLCLLADPSPDARPIREVLEGHPGSTSALVVVGPEGGFTDAEREAARRSGCTPVRVDGPVMRIETACAALTALVLYVCSSR
ncbi:MAG: RsmE family RNA methyltransferase [Planctomycetota bacterium]|jgi:16S rRNA (uracil1498-N3)-methyltransferase